MQLAYTSQRMAHLISSTSLSGDRAISVRGLAYSRDILSDKRPTDRTLGLLRCQHTIAPPPAVYATPIPSVRPSVTRVICIKTAECIIEILSWSDRPVILVFRHRGLLHKFRASLQRGRQIQGGSDFRPICSYISETVIDRGSYYGRRI